MITAHAYGSLTWIDVLHPTPEEIMALTRQYHLSFSIAEELQQPSPRAKVDATHEVLYLVLHFPNINTIERHTLTEEQEIDCIIGKEFLITVRYDSIDSVLEFEKFLSVTRMLNREGISSSGITLLYHLLKIFYRNLEQQNVHIAKTLKEIETRIFNGEEDHMVQVISRVNRTLIDQRRTLTLHDMTLDDARYYAEHIFDSHDQQLMNKLEHAFDSVQTLLQNNKDILDDLRDTNALLLNTKINTIMKVLTIITFITLPLLFGMEILQSLFEKLVHSTLSIVLILSGAVALSISVYTFFKYKRWL